MSSIGSFSAWIGFLIFILAMVAVDLGVRHKAAVVSFREALIWSIIWVAMAMGFNLFIYFWRGPVPAMEFFAGYLIEKSLSVDNLFVFIIIFRYFAVPAAYQHRVLIYGILGALVMRGVFIYLGAELLHRFHWVMYLFGATVVYSGVKLLTHKQEDINPEKNAAYRFMCRVLPSVAEFHGEKFIVTAEKKLYATPLLMVLIAIEISDLIFAVDSIPAIFAITSDPFIVFTSNIFAILGLRALFFLVAGALTKLYYLNYGLSIVLIFIGIKMLIADFYKIPISVSLAVIALVIGISAVLSLRRSGPVSDTTGA